jgi:hypothetical protein
VVDRSAAGGTTGDEKRCQRELSEVIANALRAGVLPERIRTLFREALDGEVAASTRRAT